MAPPHPPAFLPPAFLPPAFLPPVFLPPTYHHHHHHRRRRCARTTPRCVATTPHHTPHPTHPPHTPHTHLLTILTPHADPTPHLIALSHHIRTLRGVLHPPRRLSPHAVESPVTLPPLTDTHALNNTLFHSTRHLPTDAVLQPIRTARAQKRLAVFDLDSTLIAQETIDELATELGVAHLVTRITQRAMNGQLAFRDALRERVALLEGLPVTALDAVKRRVKFTDGAHELIAALRAQRCTTAVVSGGFHFLADHVRDVLGLDYSFANRLETDSAGLLTGRTVGAVVDAEYKQSTLARLATLHRVDRESILAVGDGSNDLLMMRSAGLGVAFNAKPVVQDRAQCRLNQASLRSVLYLLGQSDDDIHRLLTPASTS